MLKVAITRSPEERREAWRLRWDVFGRIEGYLAGWDKMADQEEADIYDRRGDAVIFLARHEGRPVGTVRLIVKSRRRLAIERHMPARSLRAAGPWAEASRLCVHPDYRGRHGAIDGIKVVDALCKMYFTYAMYAGLKRIVVVANSNRLHPGRVLETNSRMGFRPIGEEFFLAGFSEFAVPMAADLDDLPAPFVDQLCEDWPCIERPWNFCLYPERNMVNFWNQFAEEGYDRYRGLTDYRDLLERAEDFIGTADSVVDVGCGTGNFLERLARRPVPQLVAVDPSETMLDLARSRLHDRSDIQFHSADARRLPLPDASMDAAVALNVLFHFDDPVPALREMARVSRRCVVASGPLREGDAVGRLADQVGSDDDPALRYNRILFRRSGIRFLPDAVGVARAGKRAGLALTRYETAYNGLAYVARFERA